MSESYWRPQRHMTGVQPVMYRQDLDPVDNVPNWLLGAYADAVEREWRENQHYRAYVRDARNHVPDVPAYLYDPEPEGTDCD